MLRKKGSFGHKLLRAVVLIFACSIYGIGVSLFLDCNELAPGGVTGISILLNRVTGLETGSWMLLLNVPLLFLGFRKFGARFLISTVFGTVLTAAFTNFWAKMPPLTRDPLLAALGGSFFVALGLGLVFKMGATTGGMDIVVRLLRLRFPYLRTGTLYLFLDLSVVALSFLVFRKLDQVMYAGIAVFSTSYVLDLVLYGRDGAKMFFIISDHAAGIAKGILEEVGVGVTYLDGTGAYSGREKKVIFCVIRKQLSAKAQEIVKREDPSAFLIISSATEIFGEGYKSYISDGY